MKLSEMNIKRSDYPIIDTNGHENVFPDGVTITFVCETRVSNDVDSSEAVGAVIVVDISGKKYEDVLSTDFAVRWQNSAAKQHFKSQEHLKEWAEKYATGDNPHKVTFAQLGSVKQFDTPEEKARQLAAFLRANGVDPLDKEARNAFLDSYLEAAKEED